MICRDTPTHGWVGQWVGLGQMTKNLISLDIIKIIQFCLKICDLKETPHTHGWMHG